MSYISKINKKLKKNFGGRVNAGLRDGCLYLSGQLSDWNDVVRAGMMSASGRRYSVVNDIKYSGGDVAPAKLPHVSDSSLEGARPDVLVIGGGVIGCSIARELTRYKLSVILAEKEHDVAMHASSRNDGMVHPGIDLRKGQLKKKYNDAGNRMYARVCAELGVPFRYVGQYLCMTKRWLKPVAAGSLLYWKKAGIPAEYVNRKKLKEQEPYLSDSIKCALHFPTAGVVCPYGLTIAYAENAAENGASICLDTAVIDMDVKGGYIESVLTNRGRVYPRLVINAAGVFAEDIAKIAGDHFFSIHPRKGTNMIFDKKAAYLVKTIASPLSMSDKKTTHSKGGGIVHTVDGNLLVGPNAIETYEKENFGTEDESIHAILSKQRRSAPDLSEKDIITYFTGVRAATYEEDFIISFGRFTSNIIHAAGIQSPGLTAAPAIAVDIAEMAAKHLEADLNAKFNPIRVPIPVVKDMPQDERNALIESDKNFGVIVCRCEEVSRGEVLAALRRSIPCDTVDGVKRRVRAGMGRCQGGFCGPQVAQIIAEELNIPVDQVRKSSYDSRILLGDIKEGA